MRQLGTSADDIARGVAIDPNGNIYVAGTTRGNLDGTSAGGYDGFVAKYNGSGALQWVRQFGTTADEGGSGAIADPSGNVYVTGYTSGSLDGTNAGATDIYLVKYDTTGVKQWTRQLGTSDYDAGDAIAIDGMGNIFIAGETMGGLDGNTSAGGQDLVLVKYNDAGSKLYTRQFGSTANDVGYGIAMNLGGEAYVTGNTAGGLEGNTNAGMQDLYVVKYALNGTRVWIRQMGSASYDVGLGITVLSNDVVVFGSTGGGVDGNTNAGATDCIIVKYQQDGRKR
ncbi:MAG TPA: SBBP repeat-containing protein [Kofleriaceae bacterium]|nr:SBBP repeat-containing protein [Kofleriaceae bacterium]